MTLRKTTVVVAALWAVVAGVMYWETRELGYWQHRLAEQAARRIATEAQIRSMTNRVTAARNASARLAATLRGMHATSTDMAENENSDLRGITARNPELRKLYAQGLTADLYAKWGLLYRKLGLSPEQIDKFNGIQLRLAEAKMDLKALSETDGIPLASPELIAQSPS